MSDETGLGHGVSVRDLNRGRQKDKNQPSGTDLGLSVEREITPWSPSFHSTELWRSSFWKIERDKNIGLEATTPFTGKIETNGGPGQPGESGCGDTSAIEDEVARHLTTDRATGRDTLRGGKE